MTLPLVFLPVARLGFFRVEREGQQIANRLGLALVFVSVAEALDASAEFFIENVQFARHEKHIAYGIGRFNAIKFILSTYAISGIFSGETENA